MKIKEVIIGPIVWIPKTMFFYVMLISSGKQKQEKDI